MSDKTSVELPEQGLKALKDLQVKAGQGEQWAIVFLNVNAVLLRLKKEE